MAYTAAASAVTAQAAAQDAAKVATNDLSKKIDTLNEIAANIVRTVRAFAESSNDPGVYDRAAIAPPAPQTAVPPPALCTELTASLDASTHR